MQNNYNSTEKSYEDNIKIWETAYQEVLEVCGRYHDFEKKYGFSDMSDMIVSAKHHLMLIEWYKKYGIKLSHLSCNPFRINEYILILDFKDAEKCRSESHGCYISWPDNGEQPEDGWYLSISFPTGAYIFGEDYKYQKQLFQDLFQELKTYKPDYLDTVNNKLYWKIENSKEIFYEFDEILNKYLAINREQLNERKAKKLREELEKVEKQIKS